MESKKFIAAGLILTCGIGSLTLYSQREVMAARHHFESTNFTVIDVKKIGQHVVVTQELPSARIGMNHEQYKQCPFNDDVVWTFQAQDVIKVNYEINGIHVGQVDCPRDWTLFKANEALLSKTPF
jgi:hypothetical protein